MASEWQRIALSELYEFSSGLSKPRSEFGSGYPFLSFKDVFYNSAVPERLNELVNSTAQERNRCSVKRGDVFLTRTSETMDELGMSSVALADIPNATFNGFTKRLRPKQTQHIEPEFARYYFRCPEFRRGVTAMTSMSTRASLNNEMLARLEVVLPPLDVQVEIGETLGSLDGRIDNLRQTNATLEAIAAALFKSWFVDFDGIAPEDMQESGLGLIPKGWRAGTLADLCELKYGKALKAAERHDGIVPVYGSGGITGYHNKALVTNPTIIVGRKGTVGALYWQNSGCFPIDTVFYVEPKVSLNYCYYAMTRMGLHNLNTDAAVPGLNRDNAYRQPAVIPSIEALERWDAIASNLRSRMDEAGQQIATLTTLRDTLLPRLISGQLRIPDVRPMLNEVAQ